MIELLAPAGSMEALQAAVQNGADAVYLGCGMFNARQSAKNFTPQTLIEAVKYCHVRGVAVHLTLNTLVLGLRLAGVDHSQDQQVHWLRFSLRGRDVRPLIALGLVQPVIYYLCESYGISLTNSTFSGVIIALSPIVGLGMGALFLREYPTRAQVLSSPAAAFISVRP